MADTYTQFYIHLVMAVRNRESLLVDKHRSEIFKYMSGIITNMGHKSIIINGMPDHVHVLFGLHPAQAISDLVRELKKIHPHLLIIKTFLEEDFTGRRDMVAFRTVVRS